MPGQTAARTLHLLPSIPAAALVGMAMGGPNLGLQAALWATAAVVNLAIVRRLVQGLASARVSPLSWALKLPLTLAVVWLGLQHSDVRAMVVGLVAAVSSLLLSGALANPSVTVR